MKTWGWKNQLLNNILLGDVFEKIKEIDDNSIDVVVTSPPYWGLRDYGVKGQWGLEKDFHEYLTKLNKLMNCIRRVLKDTGTVWINLGDCYGSHRSNKDNKMVAKKQEREPLKGYEKSRMGIPERFYINCIDNGWIARNNIVWYKPNPMPSSVKDRFTNSFEMLYFFTKQKKYYFDLDSIRIPTITVTKPFNVRVRDAHKKKMGNHPKAWKKAKWEDEAYNEKGERKQDNVPSKNVNMYKGFNDRWKRKWANVEGQSTHSITLKHSGIYGSDGESLNHPKGKNPSDVWKISVKPYKGAHFATFPPDLIERILKCSCPKGGLVLDPFIGSGTTALVAKRLGLNYVGIELQKKYLKLIEQRLRDNK